ncbi:hypothetical protein RJ639_042804 [Escallonia herrerae]|uniref:MADS-box domain-containing protein n=1 Tax=Escallonia herrerae TaxID=1293975 RepID=A0AA89B773_9ASTE|nr:hypothetical protein RJ639_042804 [Escallonia herrerae]
MEEGKKRKRGHEERAMDTKMRVSYVKRKACIKKKAMELSTLCDIKVCSICLGPAGDVETWPEKPNEVHAIINMYRDKKKLEAGKSLKEMADDGGFANGLSQESLHDLYREIDAKIEAVEQRVAFLNSNRVNETSFLHHQECDNPWDSLATAPVTGYLDDCYELGCYASSTTNDNGGGSLWDILNGSGIVMPEETQNTDFMGGECWGDGNEANNRVCAKTITTREEDDEGRTLLVYIEDLQRDIETTLTVFPFSICKIVICTSIILKVPLKTIPINRIHVQAFAPT